MATSKPLNLIEAGNLQTGSRGNQVSQLQSLLKQFGYYPGAVDGVFGPQTRQAVTMFQKDNKIATDGIFGPITQSKLIEWKNNPIKAQVNDPIVKDAMAKDPNLASALTALEKEGGNRADMVAAAGELGKKGYYLGAGFTLDPQRMGMFYEEAKKQLDPEWNERLKFYEADFRESLNKEKADYESKLASAEKKFADDRFAMENQQSRAGIFKSSLGRGQRAGLVQDYNQGLQDMSRGTQYKLSDLARNYEKNLGTTFVSPFQTSLPTSNVGWFSGPSRGSTGAFSPLGNTRGALTREYESQIGRLGKEKAKEFYNPLY